MAGLRAPQGPLPPALPMLNVRELVKVYPGPVAALQGVDLDVPDGMFGLLGPNGAGKSTLMKIVAGLLEPTSGSVHLDGVDTLADPAAMWERLGYLPQDFGFYPNLTGRDMLLYLLRLKGVAAEGRSRRALCDELLERVNLTAAARRKVREYSGGMRQRLGIAQAIAGDPRILVVDEPTAGLDPEERLRLYHLLAELAESRIVLLSTHIVEDVSVLCPSFAIIRDGRLLARTSPHEARAALEGKVFEGSVTHEELEAFQRGHMVLQALLYEGRNRIRVHVPEGVSPAGFEPRRPTLEDAYLNLMRAHARKAEELAAAGAGA